MAKDHYTFLIVPHRKSAVKKISASATFLKYLGICTCIALLAVSYFLFDYAKTKKESVDFEGLKKLTEFQKGQISSLAGKIVDFEKRLEYFHQVDKKIRSMSSMETGKLKSQLRGVGGIQQEQVTENVSIESLHRNIDRLMKDADHQEQSFNEILDYLKKRESILAALPSLWPVKGWVTSNFGYRASPYGGQSEFHKGIDIAARTGNPVIAPADGIVADCVNRPDMGNYVTIDHKNGVSTGYAHLLRYTVWKGKSVKKGEVIGFVGNSGRSTGSHLHYSVMLNGVPVNPRKYLQ